MSKRIARISIATTSAALCLAVAGPAAACVVPTPGHAAFFESVNPVTAAIAKADAGIAGGLKRLDADAAKVSRDPNLSSAQRVQFAAQISAAKAQLTGEKSAVDAATSTDDVASDVASSVVQSAQVAVQIAMAIVSANDQIVGDGNRLNALATKIAADGGLSSAQKSQLMSLITAAQGQLQADRNATNAATTAAAVKAADKAASSASAPVNLRLAIDHADNQIGAVQVELTSWSNTIASATDLTDQQKAAAGARVAADQAAVAALLAKVDAATSPGQVAALLRAAHFAEHPWLSADPAKLPRHPQVQSPSPTSVVVSHPAVTVAVKTSSPRPVPAKPAGSAQNNAGRTGAGSAGSHGDSGRPVGSGGRGSHGGPGGRGNHR